MENNKSAIDNLLGIIGVVALFAIVHQAYKVLASETDTNVISDEAIKAIQNPKTADQLREAVDKYHDTGDWSKTKLESIL